MDDTVQDNFYTDRDVTHAAKDSYVDRRSATNINTPASSESPKPLSTNRRVAVATVSSFSSRVVFRIHTVISSKKENQGGENEIPCFRVSET
ncbi:hypothetical protein CEXT_168161 [Caerostris extrusa]|uniref:Uncharacterized protein n=1 Tax=Caerostris extrusa TaxID=172846 RepID=A0AAV4SEC7_CAEEX|nr:hypothetical protein CEXT_168161 [Caerostris extrusa]